MRDSLLLSCVLLGVALGSCNNDAGPAAPAPPFVRPPTPSEATPASLVIAPRVDTLAMVGQVVTLGAIVVGADGSVIAGVPVTWSSLAPGVATVGPTSGTVTAQGSGTATIQASAGPVTGTATVVVLDGPA